MDWISDMEKKELEQHINSVISLVLNMQKRDEEKSRKIQGLKEELEQNKTAREIQLEAEIQALKSELAEWKRGEFLYGFDPEERKIVDKWFQKHYEENQINDGILRKAAPHSHVTYSIDIHPEVLIKSAKCATCGKELVMYDGIGAMWEYDKEGNKKKINVRDLN